MSGQGLEGRRRLAALHQLDELGGRDSGGGPHANGKRFERGVVAGEHEAVEFGLQGSECRAGGGAQRVPPGRNRRARDQARDAGKTIVVDQERLERHAGHRQKHPALAPRSRESRRQGAEHRVGGETGVAALPHGLDSPCHGDRPVGWQRLQQGIQLLEVLGPHRTLAADAATRCRSQFRQPSSRPRSW